MSVSGGGLRVWTGMVLTVAVLSSAIPLWTCEYPPMVDYPWHVSAVSVLHGEIEPEAAASFAIDYRRSQCHLFFLLASIPTLVF